MYSKAASVILGHQDRSSDLNFCKFSAISSTPSSVTLLQPLSDSTVKFGREWTAKRTCFEVGTALQLEVNIEDQR